MWDQHTYIMIYKVCVYSMNYIMLIQYELQYDGTSSVTYYYSIITIWSFIDYGCELILISIHKINNLRIRFQTIDNINKSIFLKFASEYFLLSTNYCPWWFACIRGFWVSDYLESRNPIFYFLFWRFIQWFPTRNHSPPFFASFLLASNNQYVSICPFPWELSDKWY